MKKLVISIGFLLASYGVFAQQMPSSSGNKRDTVNQTTPGGTMKSGTDSDTTRSGLSMGTSQTDPNSTSGNSTYGSGNKVDSARSGSTTKKSTSTYKSPKGGNIMEKKSGYDSQNREQQSSKRDSLK